jgi:hypothetical protein
MATINVVARVIFTFHFPLSLPCEEEKKPESSWCEVLGDRS